MVSINNVCIIGRVVKDPELRTANSGTKITTIRIAVDQSMGKDDDTGAMFIDVTSFGKQAETVVNYFKKGSLVGVTGRLAQRKYMSNKTNTEVTVTEIIANSVCFVGPKPKDENAEEDAGNETAIEVPVYVEPTNGPTESSANKSILDTLDDDLPF